MALFPLGKGLFLQFLLGNEAHLASDRLQRLASAVLCHTTYTEILVKLWRLLIQLTPRTGNRGTAIFDKFLICSARKIRKLHDSRNF